ncbi:MAG TPA: carbohydrate kinase family protein [Candidatus Paceibacterota bacterium]|nr:carbohydrate kinase family protein [Candidatus Paceibacterota bacterium]
MKYDFVSFGDITTDCFIKLKDARVHCNINNEDCELCVKFGQKIPFESATVIPAVGNGPNAAVAVARIGFSSAAACEMGDDANGAECLQRLKDSGVHTELVGIHAGMPTNYHYVLMYEAERTILIKHQLYGRELPKFDEPPQWFYLTSLAEGTEEFQHAIAAYAKANSVRLCFQPGTFQIKMGKEKLADIYTATEIFFCNKEEAQMILNTQEADVKKLMQGIHALGPKIVVVTDGPNGSNILEQDGSAWHAPMYPDPAPPVSRTGAGDATASTTVAYLMKGLPPREALLRGLINAASVVQGIGAQTKLLTADEIEAWYQKRPPQFQVVAL